jgi:hypothetical protein|nr:MAG TPA: minor tail protein [Caudoviricetes sp.]
MPTPIEALELQVQSNGNTAVAGIDALSASLTRLKTATKGGIGLTSVANQLKNLNSALASMDGSAATKIDRLATSLDKLKNLGNLKISSSIGNQLKNIGNAATALNGVDFSGLSKLSTAMGSLGTIGRASGLQSAITQLQKIPQLVATLNGVNWNQFTGQIQRLTNALAPLANQLNTVSAAFNNLPANIRRVVTATNAMPSANNAAAKSYLNLWAKARMAYNVVRMGAQVIASWITQSNKYIEDLNLFNVSMGEYAEQAHEYAERVSAVMGIDPAEWMRNQGIFNTITKGFGVASDRAYIMSKNLTQLGYDLSSFFNISYEDAFQKLQSGIAGELEPLRRLGYDLSVARLQEEALALGITKKVSAMTQAEKSELRYYAIMTQVTAAQGDMARTLNAPANQLRILQAEVTQAARALGNIFIPILNAVLPYAIALARVIRMLASAIASLFGFKLPEVDYSGLASGAGAVGDLADSADDAAGGLGGAAKKAKELKNALLGIDELNIISPPEDTAGSGSGAGGIGGVGGGGLGFDLPEYDFLGNAIENKVDEIIKKWKEWLGLTDDIDTWAEFFHTRLGHILTTIGAIGLGMAAWKISKNVLNFMDWLNKLKGHGLTNPLNIAVGISLLVTGISLEWAGIVDTILNELDGENFAQIISGGLLTVGGGAFLGKGLAGWITTAFADSAVAKALATAASNLGLGSATAAGAALGAGIAGIIAGLPAYFTGIWDAIHNGLNWLNGLLIPAGSTAAAAGIGAIIGACGGPIGAGIGALIGLAVGLITDGIIAITEHWDAITDWFDNFFHVTIPNLWNSFVKWLKNLPTEISEWFTGLWKPIKEFDWYAFGREVGGKVGTAVKSICDAFKTFFTETLPQVWEDVKTSFKTFFTETLPQFFTETIPELWNTVKDAFVEFFTVTLPEALGDIKQWFVDVGQSIWDGIKEGWDTAVQAVKDFVTGFIDGFKEALGIHSPSTVMRDEVGVFLGEGLLEGIAAPFKAIGKWVKKHILDPISNFIKNNPISDLVVNVKNKASEWWQNVKTWWADKTKDGVSLDAMVNLVKNGWSTVKNWIGNIPVISQAISLVKQGWETVKKWVGNIPTLSQGIELVKEKWQSVKSWIGNIPIVQQGVELIKSGWQTVKSWIGNIPILSQGISLLKSGWTTVKNWVGNIPTLDQAIQLVKSGWQTVKTWIGNIPILSQGISLLKSGWTTVKNWIGNIPVLSQGISLLKSGWTTVKNWVGNIPVLSQGISLLKSGWTSVKNWIGSIPVISQGISLVKSGWTSLSNWIGTASSVGISLWRNGWSSISSFIGTSVSVGISLFKSGWTSIKKFFGLSTGGTVGANGGVKFGDFASGGIITPNMMYRVPAYANGTNRPHGSMFVAGEKGAELVGHVNGTTEVLNRFQLGQVMHTSIIGGMRLFTGYWRTMNSQMVQSANAIISSILVSADTITASLASPSGYDPYRTMTRTIFEEGNSAYNDTESDESMYSSMRDFYREFVEPTIKEIAADTKRQADKEERTVVQIGSRTITETVDTQRKANGYVFAK